VDIYYLVSAKLSKPDTEYKGVRRWRYGAHSPDGSQVIVAGEFSALRSAEITALGGKKMTRGEAAAQARAWDPVDPTSGGTRAA